MTTRINLMLDLDSPLSEEMMEHDPPVIDCIRADGTVISKFLAVTEGTAIDGRRIVALLGATERDDLTPTEGHTIESDAEKEELVEILTEMAELLDDSADTRYGLQELRTSDDTPDPEAVLDDQDLERLNAHRKATQIRDLMAFALEHDVDLEMG